ncbi:MAG: hypothetical protein LBD77_03815 [Bifidobacteriaceae bacterium]|jgi:hypothetical protein|nr:hypothetical protein [Bifidobacteriaceae bacterium]
MASVLEGQPTMCTLFDRAREAGQAAPSLGLIQPTAITDLEVSPHPGWNTDQLAKVSQLQGSSPLFGPGPPPALEAPRFQGAYVFRCSATCRRRHRLSILDWEFVTLQRRLTDLGDAEARDEIRRRFLTMMCSPDRATFFFVGNQAKRPQAFSVLGVFYPPLEDLRALAQGSLF